MDAGSIRVWCGRFVGRLAVATVLALLAGGAQADVGSGPQPEPWLDRRMSDADRRHLLARTGIGVAPADYVALQGLSRREGVAWIVAGLAREPSQPMPDWTRAPLPPRHAQPDATSDERQRYRHERDAEFASLRGWWSNEILRTASPQTERLVLLWHDLVPSDYRNSGRAPLMLARQNALLRRSHSGRWQDLLEALLRDGALLSYLDASSNRRDAPNENLGREFLELFTLGEGHYREQDVREAARALTGLGISTLRDGEFVLRSGQQDRDSKTLFGRTGPFDANDLIALTLSQTAAARHLVRRYWAVFVSDEGPPAAELDALADTFRRSDHDLGVLYRSMLHSEAFWSDTHRATLVKSPVDIVSGLLRTLEYPKRHWQRVLALQDAMGMALFEPPNVAGWDEGDAYVSVGRLLARQQGASELLHETVAGAGTAGMMASEPANAEPSMDKRAMGGRAMGGPSMRPASGMQAGSRESESMSESSMAPSVAASAVLHVASEAFQGPVRTRVLLQEGAHLLWDSGPLPLSGGHDTERRGRLEDRSHLPWQQVVLEAPQEAVRRADTVRVLFLNDAAGEDGDRNLYVDRIVLGERVLLARDGLQHSSCVPESPVDAGNLYCHGQVTLVDRWVGPTASTASSTAMKAGQGKRAGPGMAGEQGVPTLGQRPVASAVHLSNMQGDDDGRIVAHVVLDDLNHGGRHWPVVAFRVLTWSDRPAEVRIDSFGCHDGCLESWPACAWRDAHFAPMRSMSVPLSADARDRDACLAQLQVGSDRALLGLLAAAAPQLSALLLDGVGERLERHRETLRMLDDRLSAQSVPARQDGHSSSSGSPASPVSGPLLVDSRLAAPYRAPDAVRSIKPRVNSAEALDQAMALVGIDPATLLWPGLPTEGMPGQPGQSLAGRLRTISEHPAFQLR